MDSASKGVFNNNNIKEIQSAQLSQYLTYYLYLVVEIKERVVQISNVLLKCFRCAAKQVKRSAIHEYHAPIFYASTKPISDTGTNLKPVRVSPVLST